MDKHLWQLLARIALIIALSGCASGVSRLPEPPNHPNGQILWQIVHEHCVPNQVAHGNPDPCIEVGTAKGSGNGFAILKDRTGATQYLVMPTNLITGIEDPQLLAPDSTNYFARAWTARRFVEEKLGKELARDDVSIAVNSAYGRSQDLLHLHVDCVRIDVRDAIRQNLTKIGRNWSRFSVPLDGHPYRAVRIDGDFAPVYDPFHLLANGLHVRPREMGAWTLVLVGARFPDQRPGFVLLASRADPDAGYNGSGEVLQDHDCAGRRPD
jgi:CDP-diacylglycerol pyrophosphatase